MNSIDGQNKYPQGGTIAENLAEILERIAAAAARAGRRAEDVALVAVSKVKPASCVMEALAAGQTVFGESRIQEALSKIDEVGPGPFWHMIGHLQTNKVRQAVGKFDLIHTVDSLRLIEEMDKRAGMAGVEQKLLLQINVSGETAKSGAAPDELPRLIEAVEASANLRALGLMTIPPYDLDPDAARPHFAALRTLAAGAPAGERFRPDHLSMGMSGDFEVAVEEGATLVRVGSAIFGKRR